MELEYDIRFNIGYIKFKEKVEQVTSLKISEDLVIDMAADGSIYGIELLNLKDQLFGNRSGGLLLYNENSGNKKEVELPT
ncbi:MAG: DUF2283 domain-containing protein [Cytophagales bacterium]|jgi:uncharacterized protein YuzE|nr:DUF2283 domain-containing protein [Cytophagales bacterium]MCA6388227.1 DUF2283 domain-containing protein [Cytophagales bacterium]MCA6393083.1 DUF2283 domain-containing protein [Cytophagales bacterium]MCA6393664.1 DUF2283 domain-containing protein [Cytophagales bacterium]MCA6400234.1 DUF2283 domain-containing protein [Cytophagales bacterium]